MLQADLTTINDEEGACVPDGSGVVIDAHGQCFDLDSEIVDPIFDVCKSNEKPVVIHIGKEPKSQSYNCITYEICSVDKLERVLIDFPELKICAPHLGFGETREYKQLSFST